MNLRRVSWELKFALWLVVAFVALNLVHYVCYRDLGHIFLWNLTSLAFLPVSVLVVTLFVERMLAAREREQRLQKTNMLVGVFFSTVGTRLLERCVALDAVSGPLRETFGSLDAWDNYTPRQAQQVLGDHPYALAPSAAQLHELKDLLVGQRDLLLRLLENPILLEHESFTDLLRAVFHLIEELSFRTGFDHLPSTDLDHLAGDTKRVYGLLIREWVNYLVVLRTDYPYLFSLSVRTNPLAEHPSAIVR